MENKKAVLPPELEKDGGWGDLATKMEHNGGVVGFYLQKWRRIVEIYLQKWSKIN